MWFVNMVACTYFMSYLYGYFVVYSENFENILEVCCVNNIRFSDLRISFLRIIRKYLKLKNYVIGINFLLFRQRIGCLTRYLRYIPQKKRLQCFWS